METDAAGEWLRLTEHYRQMYDEELLRLADEFGGLTEMARQVLRDEMRVRGLGDPSQPVVRKPAPVILDREAAIHMEPGRRRRSPDAGHDEPEDEIPHEFTWKTELCECDTQQQAWQLAEVLRREGIDSWLDTSRTMDGSGYARVLVGADQLDEAREVADRPIPQEIIDESNQEVPEFTSPRCPRCGAEDPTLLSAEPANAWVCEICDHEWMED